MAFCITPPDNSIAAAIRPDHFKARAKLAKSLSDILGDHHDLVVFRAALKDDDSEETNVIDALAHKRCETLSGQATEQAKALLAEEAGDLLDQIAHLWAPWARRHGFA